MRYSSHPTKRKRNKRMREVAYWCLRPLAPTLGQWDVGKVAVAMLLGALAGALILYWLLRVRP